MQSILIKLNEQEKLINPVKDSKRSGSQMKKRLQGINTIWVNAGKAYHLKLITLFTKWVYFFIPRFFVCLFLFPSKSKKAESLQDRARV